VARHRMGAAVVWEKGEEAGFSGTQLSGERLKLAKKTKEDRMWLLKVLGIDNHLIKGTGAVMRRSTGGGTRLQGGNNGGGNLSRNRREKDYCGSG